MQTRSLYWMKDEGKIMGVGTSEELLATNEIYREVYESQVKGGEDDE